MKSKHLVLYLITILVACGGIGTSWGYSADTPLWTHFSFHFAHGNVFHLAANMLVVFTIIFGRDDKWWLWAVSYIVAVVSSFIIATTTPTIGLSGILFAYYGIIFLKDGARWKPLLQLTAFMAVSCLFASRMAVELHFICLLIGALIGGVIDIKKEIKNQDEIYGKKKQGTIL